MYSRECLTTPHNQALPPQSRSTPTMEAMASKTRPSPCD